MVLLRNIFFLLLSLPVTACYAQVGDTLPVKEPIIECVFFPINLEPQCINFDAVMKNISYPDSLKQAKIQGSVVLKIFTDKEGMPIDYQVVESRHPLFTQEVVKHYSALRFTPMTKQSKPRKQWVLVPFHFYLPKDEPSEPLPAPDDFQIVDQEPKCINLDTLKKGLQFPDSLKQTGSRILIKLLINKDGIPIRHIVKRSPHPLITAEFERHIYHLRFTPALKDGQPLLFWVNLPVQWCNRR